MNILRRSCLYKHHISLCRDLIKHTTLVRSFCDASNREYDLTTYKLPFTSNQQSYLLNKVNAITPEELTQLKVTKKLIRELMKSKMKIGSYTELSELLYINGFGIKAVENLCHKLLNNKEEGEVEDIADLLEEKILKKRLVMPCRSAQRLEEVRTVVTIDLTAGCLAWVKMDRMGQIEDMNTHQVLNEETRFNTQKIFNKIMYLGEKIPEADLYVLEERSNHYLAKAPMNTISVALQLAEIKGMLMMLLQKKLMDKEGDLMNEKIFNGDGVIFMKDYVVSKLFNLMRSHGRASCMTVADDLMNGHEPISWLSWVNVDEEMREQYFATEPVLRRHTATAILMGFAFNKAVLHQNIEVLKILINPKLY